MIAIHQSILLMFLTSGIFNISQGIRFVVGAVLLRKIVSQNKAAGLFYGWEAAGAFGGGFIFAFVLQKFTDPFQTAGLIAIINIISFLPVFSFDRKKSFIISWLTVFFAFCFCFFFPQGSLYSKMNTESLMRQWKLEKPPVYYSNTHYGNITVFEKNRQLSFMVDGHLLFTSPGPDLEWIESMSHFPLLSSAKTETVLLIGAGIKGVIPEILKYDVQRIDCIEINPELVQAIKKFSSSYFSGYESEKIRIIEDDALRFLRKTEKKWDVIIVYAGIPLSLKNARFYTEEFFVLIKNHLSKDGVFYLGLEGSSEYMSAPLADVHGIIYSTLRSVFSSISVFPGYLTGYCARTEKYAGEISYEMLVFRKKERKITTTVLTDFYLKNRLDQEKKDHFFRMIKPAEKMKNSQNRPFIVIPATKYWLFLATGKLGKPISKIVITFFSAVLIGLVYLSYRKNKNIRTLELTVFSTGFLSVAWELIFLFLFQMYFGSLYFYLSILTGIFMGGMTAGSIAFSYRVKNQVNLKKFLFYWQLAQTIFAMLVIGSAVFVSEIMLYLAFFFIAILIIGFFAGVEFPLVNGIYLIDRKLFSDSISRFYALDLAGATAGSLLTAILLVPAAGIVLSCIMFGVFKLLVAFSVFKYCLN